MANGTGTATIDFGAGANEVSVAVTGLTGIGATDECEAWFMSESGGDHTEKDHRYAALFVNLSCSRPTAGVGFTIYATSIYKMTGSFTVNYVWAG
jgi:hypothetical protein